MEIIAVYSKNHSHPQVIYTLRVKCKRVLNVRAGGRPAYCYNAASGLFNTAITQSLSMSIALSVSYEMYTSYSPVGYILSYYVL